MQKISSAEAVQEWALGMRAEGHSVALVPTMGYLHDGHMSLVRIAKQQADRVVVSLFVNPTQFGPQEDLEAYPRDFERDCLLCENEGVDVLFCPRQQDMYAPDHSVFMDEEQLSRGLCGASRPGHFRGVLTIVAKLFLLVQPTLSVFGEKDAQQLRVIRRMVRDFHFPVRIVGGPIVREPDGLAMSSRNANLSPEARAQAVVLRQALVAVDKAVQQGEVSVGSLRAMVDAMLATASLARLDYLAFVDDETLEPQHHVLSGQVLVAIAVQFPGARLIDNQVVEVPA